MFPEKEKKLHQHEHVAKLINRSEPQGLENGNSAGPESTRGYLGA